MKFLQNDTNCRNQTSSSRLIHLTQPLSPWPPFYLIDWSLESLPTRTCL